VQRGLEGLVENPAATIFHLRDTVRIYVDVLDNVYLTRPSLLYQFRTLTKEMVSIREMAVFSPFCLDVGKSFPSVTYHFVVFILKF
jgi:hypothetical protein